MFSTLFFGSFPLFTVFLISSSLLITRLQKSFGICPLFIFQFSSSFLFIFTGILFLFIIFSFYKNPFCKSVRVLISNFTNTSWFILSNCFLGFWPGRPSIQFKPFLIVSFPWTRSFILIYYVPVLFMSYHDPFFEDYMVFLSYLLILRILYTYLTKFYFTPF